MTAIAIIVLVVGSLLFLGGLYLAWVRGRDANQLREAVMDVARRKLEPASVPRGDSPAQVERALELVVRQLESDKHNSSDSTGRYEERIKTLERLLNERLPAALVRIIIEQAMAISKADAGYVAIKDPETDEYTVKDVAELPRMLVGSASAGLGAQATREPSVLAEIFGTEAATTEWEKQYRSLLGISLEADGERKGAIVLYRREEPFLQSDLDELAWLAGPAGVVLRQEGDTSQLRGPSLVDEVTGVFTDSFFWSQAERELERSRRFSHPASLLLLIVDNFELYVDAYGSQMGDRILKMIADVMKENVRDVDMIARHRDNEFAIILPETDLPGARVVGEKIRQEIQTKGLIMEAGKKFWLTVSIATATSPLGEATPRGLYHVADQALSQAKHSRNRVVNYLLSLTSKRAEGS